MSQCEFYIPEKILNDTVEALNILSMSWFALGLVLGPGVYFIIEFLVVRYSKKYCQCKSNND